LHLVRLSGGPAGGVLVPIVAGGYAVVVRR
jgi:hypothetical protein